jgi:hypothetical protein
MPPSDSPRFSQLSPSRKALVRLCQSANYGHIQDLDVRDREPVFSEKCLIFVDFKLDSEELPREEATEPDFMLCVEVVRLMALLDKIGHGKIAKLEVRAGLPRLAGHRRDAWGRRGSEEHLSRREYPEPRALGIASVR